MAKILPEATLIRAERREGMPKVSELIKLFGGRGAKRKEQTKKPALSPSESQIAANRSSFKSNQSQEQELLTYSKSEAIHINHTASEHALQINCEKFWGSPFAKLTPSIMEWKVWNRDVIGRRRYEGGTCLDNALQINGDCHPKFGIHAPGIWRERGPEGGTMIPWKINRGWYEHSNGTANWGYSDIYEIRPALKSVSQVNGYESNIAAPGVARYVSTVCQSCANIPLEHLWQNSGEKYFISDCKSSLKYSAKSCQLCDLILSKLEHNDSMEGQSEKIFVQIGPRETETLIQHCSPKMQVGSDSETATISTLFPAGSNNHMRLLTEWLRTCDEEHSHPNSFSAELPTRIIKVRDVDNSDVLRLHVAKPGERGRYLALSYCWGKARPFTTTKETLEDRCNSIDFDKLPKTFQDAVTVARGLRVQYLWIDSLCIVQDDPNDWRLEAARMEKVYVSAYCTIAATSSKNGEQGFLSRSQANSIRIHKGGRSKAEIIISKCEEDFERDVENGALNQRAWVLQERALSRRIIHFTDAQTYWECGTCIRCETTDAQLRPLNSLARFRFPLDTSVADNASHVFEDVFERYSKLALTFWADRPTAVLGLESRLAIAYNTPSVYGILPRFFGKSLFWERSGKQRLEEITNFPHDKVPSWSWMCYKGPINFQAGSWGNITWTEDLKLAGTQRKWAGTSDGSLEIYNAFRFLLAGLRARILETCSIVPHQDIDCRIVDENQKTVGWAKYDMDDDLAMAGLSCIVLGKSILTQQSCACASWDISGACSKPCDLVYVLLIKLSGMQVGETKLYRRLGIAIVRTEFLVQEHVLNISV